MEKRRKLLFLAGLVLLVAALSLAVYTSAFGAPYSGYTYGSPSGLYINLIREHNEPASINNAECLTCHDNLLLDVSPANSDNANEPASAHKRHVMSVFLNFADNVSIGLGGGSNPNGCVKCHSGSDIDNERGVVSALRKQVNPQECLKCHGVFDTDPNGSATAHRTTRVRDGVPETVTVDKADPRGCVSTIGETGVACHESAGSGKTALAAHTQNWINATYANSENYCLKCHGGRSFYVPKETN